MTETTTQFAARALGLLPHEPPPPKRGSRYAAHPLCWLCGGLTGGVGWHQSEAITPTFTQHNTARRQDSDAVCQSCVALTEADTFQHLIAARSLPIKTWAQCGWHSYSHHIREDGHYEAPTPSGMRALLLDPPVEAWLLTINTSGKKHTIFRATVAHGRDRFPVQIDEETLWIQAEEFRACLAAFEHLAALGCGKDGIETGQYHPADAMRAGLAAWYPAEQAMAPWRANPALVGLVRIVARSAKTIAEAGEAITRAPVTPAIPTRTEPQGMLL